MRAYSNFVMGALMLAGFGLSACDAVERIVLNSECPNFIEPENRQVLTIGGVPIDVRSAESTRDASAGPLMKFALTPDSAILLADLTRDKVGQQLDIMIGDRLLSSPRVMEPILGGYLQLSGSFTEEEADQMLENLGLKCAE